MKEFRRQVTVTNVLLVDKDRLQNKQTNKQKLDIRV